MRIDSRDLLGLPVVTVSGVRLGKVLSFELDADTHAVALYHVGPRNWPGSVRHAIAPPQILSVTAEQMTVRDGAVAEEAGEGRRVGAPVASPSPLATSARE